MKYKVGDKVKIKSLDWYKANKCKGFVMCDGLAFIKDMTEYCGKELTIDSIYIDHNSKYEYTMKEPKIRWIFNEGMFEGLADDNSQDKMVSLNEVCNMLYAMLSTQDINDYDYVTAPAYDTVEDLVEDFRKSFEE